MSNLKQRTKHISLRFMGEGWEDAYIDFRAIKWSDAKALKKRSEEAEAGESMAVLVSFMQDKFIAGQGIDEQNQSFALTKEDIAEFDLETINTLGERLAGAPDPNA